jgi:signal transduction histidine kinase
VSIDVKQIKQVILNMVKNAMDAIEDVGEEHTGLIQISTGTENKYVQISIADNGQGMDHNTLVRLFDPFFTTKESGTGLGLSVSYRIIKNHGGNISVDSKKGEGTRFIIMLPLV